MKKLGFGFMRLPLTTLGDQTNIDMVEPLEVLTHKKGHDIHDLFCS